MSDISRLRGVGPAIAEKLDALGIRSARELLFFLPSGYTDLGDPVAVSDAEDGAYSLVKGSVISLTKPSPRGKRGFTVRLADCLDGRGAPFTVTYYNQPYFHSAFAGGGEFVFLAKFRGGERSLVNPVFDKADGDKLGGVFVSYPLRGLIGRRTFIKLLREAISAERAEDGEAEQFAELFEKVHFPSSVGEAGEALTRLAALDLAAGIAVYKASVVRGDKSRRRRYDLPPDIVGEYVSLLPVTPTESQLAAMRDIAADLSGAEKMSRVVSGDVGSGKTLVAFFAAYAAARAGRQCAVMAPTEILAAQHAAKFAALFSGKISSGLLTASTGAKEAQDILRGLADGTLSVAFGTQSLVSRRVNFRDLATAVIDEQHKFGVAERAELQNKGAEDVLTLTATPIPRSHRRQTRGSYRLHRLRVQGGQTGVHSLPEHTRLGGVRDALRRKFRGRARRQARGSLLRRPSRQDERGRQARAHERVRLGRAFPAHRHQRRRGGRGHKGVDHVRARRG